MKQVKRMMQVKRVLLAVVLALLVGIVIPVQAESAGGCFAHCVLKVPLLIQESTDAVPFATNTPQIVDAPVIVEATPVVDAPPDGTVDVPPVIVDTRNPELLYIMVTVVVLGALAALVLIGRPLILQLGASAPAWAFEGGVTAARQALVEATEYAESTPVLYDDVAVAELVRKFNELEAEVRTLRAATLSQG